MNSEEADMVSVCITFLKKILALPLELLNNFEKLKIKDLQEVLNTWKSKKL